MQKVILTCVMRSSALRSGLESRAKKNPETLTCVGLVIELTVREIL